MDRELEDSTQGEESSPLPPSGRRPAGSRRGPVIGLSGKLLLLTIGFVMIAEVLVFVPSVANFRRNWLMERLAAAQIAAIAADAMPGHEIPAQVRDELLQSAKVSAIAFKREEARQLIMRSDMPTQIDGHYDLGAATPLELVWDALAVFVAPSGRHIRVVGQPGFGPGKFIEIVMSEEPLKAALIGYALNILALSILISMFTAALVYLAINALLIRPMTRLTANMVRFGEDPEDPARRIVPSRRSDEIGTAERELAQMQTDLAETLKQKSRLAALGLAVSKINHDLRNMLANAQLISDRLGAVQDPTVQRFAPKLIASLDRAIRLCTDTLKYGRAREAPPHRRLFPLEPLVREVGDSLGLPRESGIGWRVEIEPGLEVDADASQLYRVLANLVRNGCQALEQDDLAGLREIVVGAWREGAVVAIEVSDTGPGVSEQARERLFMAFQGSARKGGTGLGLAIAAELVRAHGGGIEHVPTKRGATFRLTIPDRVVDLEEKRRRA